MGHECNKNYSDTGTLMLYIKMHTEIFLTLQNNASYVLYIYSSAISPMQFQAYLD